MDLQSLGLGALLFQTGYLTVSKIEFTDVWPEYVLAIPNFEVRHAFFNQLTAGLCLGY